MGCLFAGEDSDYSYHFKRSRFDKCIIEGHLFARTVHESAVVLYGKKESEL